MRRTVLLPLAYYWMHSCQCNVYVNVKTYSIGTSVLAPPPLQYCSREEFSCSRAGQRSGFRTRGGIYTYETYSTISTSPRPTQPLNNKPGHKSTRQHSAPGCDHNQRRRRFSVSLSALAQPEAQRTLVQAAPHSDTAATPPRPSDERSRRSSLPAARSVVHRATAPAAEWSRPVEPAAGPPAPECTEAQHERLRHWGLSGC